MKMDKQGLPPPAFELAATSTLALFAAALGVNALVDTLARERLLVPNMLDLEPFALETALKLSPSVFGDESMV